MNRTLITKEEIKERRLILGLTPRELGEFCYMSKQTVLNYENGKVKNQSGLYLLELITDQLLEANGFGQDCKSKVFKKIGPITIKLDRR